jgi:hypothetical protein
MILYRVASFLHTGCIIQYKGIGRKGQLFLKLCIIRVAITFAIAVLDNIQV